MIYTCNVCHFTFYQHDAENTHASIGGGMNRRPCRTIKSDMGKWGK